MLHDAISSHLRLILKFRWRLPSSSCWPYWWRYSNYRFDFGCRKTFPWEAPSGHYFYVVLRRQGPGIRKCGWPREYRRSGESRQKEGSIGQFAAKIFKMLELLGQKDSCCESWHQPRVRNCHGSRYWRPLQVLWCTSFQEDGEDELRIGKRHGWCQRRTL